MAKIPLYEKIMQHYKVRIITGEIAPGNKLPTENEIANGALVVLYHKDLDLIKNKIVESGGRISKDIFSFPGGRRFHFTDPAGNELAVWSDK